MVRRGGESVCVEGEGLRRAPLLGAAAGRRCHTPEGGDGGRRGRRGGGGLAEPRGRPPRVAQGALGRKGSFFLLLPPRLLTAKL